MRDILVQNSLVSKKYLETIKALDGQVQNLPYHQERLNAALNSSDIYDLEEYLKPPKEGLYKCRVVYDERDIELSYLPYEKRTVSSLKIVYNDEIDYTKKYLERSLLNELFALRADSDDILIVKGGLITDTSIANVTFFDGVDWITPKRPLLKGTTRERYLRSHKIVEKDIFVDDLKSFQKLALMNAMIDFDIIAEENLEDIIC